MTRPRCTNSLIFKHLYLFFIVHHQPFSFLWIFPSINPPVFLTPSLQFLFLLLLKVVIILACYHVGQFTNRNIGRNANFFIIHVMNNPGILILFRNCFRINIILCTWSCSRKICRRYSGSSPWCFSFLDNK